MRKLISISTIFLLLSCKQEAKTEVTDFEIYEVINLMLLNESEILALEKLNLGISKSDVKFIQLQNKNRSTFKLNQKLLENSISISRDTLTRMKQTNLELSFWKRFIEKYHEKELFSISLPLFSKDKNTALVSTSFICATCLNSETMIYRKVNGKWKLIEVLSSRQI